MAAQRVLHTFTHHADPVWSLFSSHPNLERFYSGDRKGNIAIVDMERCSDVSEGECILLSSSASSDPSSSPTSSTFPSSQNDPSTSKQPNPLANRSCMGINKIVAMDDAYVWASTSSSSVSMWKDVGKRTKRSPGFRPNGMLDEDPFDQQQDEEDDEPFQMDGMEPATAGGYVPSPSAVPRSGSLRNFDAARSSSPSDPPLPTASYHNKRLSFDFSANSLGPTRSRDSQSVAFAPTSLLPAPIDRAVSFGHSLPPNPSSNDGYTSPLLRNIRKDRINTISASSSNASDNPHQNSSETFTSQLNPPNPTSFSTKHLVHHGVPYESLVNLGSMDSPYGLFSFSGGGGRRADVEISTIYSAASVLSVPHYARHHSHTTDPGVGGAAASVEKQQPPPLLSSRLSTRSEKDLVREAWLEFEEREEVAEAIPVRKRPDGVIEGKHGLVRSLILNDKQHVVTCDTAGGQFFPAFIPGDHQLTNCFPPRMFLAHSSHCRLVDRLLPLRRSDLVRRSSRRPSCFVVG
jgi:WD repeat-containing protein 48